MADANTNETASGGYTTESYVTYASASGEPDSTSTLPDRYHHNFISIFSAAHQLKVDILEATWQPALGTLGAGGSSHISLSNRSTSQLAFNFKRRKLTDNSPEAIAKLYRGLICEMLILRHPAVREHPNVTSLQGIAWEFYQGVAWPVLVFPEASHGSLASFIQGEGGKTASLEELLRICAGCGLGLEALHRNGIIHGDIKPENILVSQERGLYKAKLTDFEASCISSSDDDLVKLGRTVPWDAPEWHTRCFTIKGAKQTDIYSFGLRFSNPCLVRLRHVRSAHDD
ncbi:kinase-like domain-containing protein [Lasiosphaeria ovina]|uniref:Kinase-like domain-containing protein n=1 Tax=Lasiosphaeria ovina TaxID=92902 RepID=A0AAE0TYX8_9PEZI|nr:kinase-like domain-containing protein [Lasiosphaeria ovina]